MVIEFDGIQVEHRVNPRMKHAYLSVEADGTVVLKSNGRGQRHLQAFVTSKREWILRQQNRYAAQPTMRLGESLLFLGDIVPLTSLDAAFQTHSPEALRRSCDRFYRERAEAVLREKTALFAERMGVTYEAIRFRKMKRRWGSCSKTGVITYNTLLLQLEEAMVDYTVVHELAHRVHFNHSADFHALVASILPDEKALRLRMRHRKASYY
ncbi:M48 family metallopeptidase [Sulfurimonas sp. HSL-3221]|uniref:M48 family metallopeptidase n=1 Tax=Sulfurimonadaceae TaxID=2771471 RepID=UPI001E385017|nr:SprT family zinc-dependent metalloprotease [Sulfurimonas sp. HSL-3221]UFS61330.1 M48 family metallopeptidase [Sulfurimonas sp. HSL-3221]